MESNTTPQPTVVPSASQDKTNAILAWLFAPLTSFLWKDDPSEFVRAHARESLYFGVANILLVVVFLLLQICYGIVMGVVFGSVYSLSAMELLLACIWNILWLAVWAFGIVPRIIGMVKANGMQTWTVPVVNEQMKKFIKL